MAEIFLNKKECPGLLQKKLALIEEYKGFIYMLCHSNLSYTANIDTLLKAWDIAIKIIQSYAADSIDNLLYWTLKHTISLMLQMDWSSLSKFIHIEIRKRIQIVLSRIIFTSKSYYHCTFILNNMDNPWGNDKLLAVVRGEKSEVTENDLEFFASEKLSMVVLRLKKLCETNKCHRIAYILCSKVLNVHRIAEQNHQIRKFATNSQINFVFDVYLCLLHKFEQIEDIVTELSKLGYRDIIDLIKRNICSIEEYGRFAKYRLRLSQLVIEITLIQIISQNLNIDETLEYNVNSKTQSISSRFSTVKIKIENESDNECGTEYKNAICNNRTAFTGVDDLFYTKFRELFLEYLKIHRDDSTDEFESYFYKLFGKGSSKRILIACDVMREFANPTWRIFMWQTVVRAINTDLNELERMKYAFPVDVDSVLQYESELLKNYEIFEKFLEKTNRHLERECVLTEFSLCPSVELYEKVCKQAKFLLKEKRKNILKNLNSSDNVANKTIILMNDLENSYHYDRKHNDKIDNNSFALNEEHKFQQKFDITNLQKELTTELIPKDYLLQVMDETDNLPKEIREDLVGCLMSPRVKMLTWSMNIFDLDRICRMLLEPNSKRNIIKKSLADANDKLTHVKVDPREYSHLPYSLEFPGIEKGYEIDEDESENENLIDLKPTSPVNYKSKSNIINYKDISSDDEVLMKIVKRKKKCKNIKKKFNIEDNLKEYPPKLTLKISDITDATAAEAEKKKKYFNDFFATTSLNELTQELDRSIKNEPCSSHRVVEIDNLKETVIVHHSKLSAIKDKIRMKRSVRKQYRQINQCRRKYKKYQFLHSINQKKKSYLTLNNNSKYRQTEKFSKEINSRNIKIRENEFVKKRNLRSLKFSTKHAAPFISKKLTKKGRSINTTASLKEMSPLNVTIPEIITMPLTETISQQETNIVIRKVTTTEEPFKQFNVKYPDVLKASFNMVIPLPEAPSPKMIIPVDQINVTCPNILAKPFTVSTLPRKTTTVKVLLPENSQKKLNVQYPKIVTSSSNIKTVQQETTPVNMITPETKSNAFLPAYSTTKLTSYNVETASEENSLLKVRFPENKSDTFHVTYPKSVTSPIIVMTPLNLTTTKKELNLSQNTDQLRSSVSFDNIVQFNVKVPFSQTCPVVEKTRIDPISPIHIKVPVNEPSPVHTTGLINVTTAMNPAIPLNLSDPNNKSVKMCEPLKLTKNKTASENHMQLSSLGSSQSDNLPSNFLSLAYRTPVLTEPYDICAVRILQINGDMIFLFDPIDETIKNYVSKMSLNIQSRWELHKKCNFKHIKIRILESQAKLYEFHLKIEMANLGIYNKNVNNVKMNLIDFIKILDNLYEHSTTKPIIANKTITINNLTIPTVPKNSVLTKQENSKETSSVLFMPPKITKNLQIQPISSSYFSKDMNKNSIYITKTELLNMKPVSSTKIIEGQLKNSKLSKSYVNSVKYVRGNINSNVVHVNGVSRNLFKSTLCEHSPINSSLNFIPIIEDSKFLSIVPNCTTVTENLKITDINEKLSKLNNLLPQLPVVKTYGNRHFTNCEAEQEQEIPTQYKKKLQLGSHVKFSANDKLQQQIKFDVQTERKQELKLMSQYPVECRQELEPKKLQFQICQNSESHLQTQQQKPPVELRKYEEQLQSEDQLKPQSNEQQANCSNTQILKIPQFLKDVTLNTIDGKKADKKNESNINFTSPNIELLSNSIIKNDSIISSSRDSFAESCQKSKIFNNFFKETIQNSKIPVTMTSLNSNLQNYFNPYDIKSPKNNINVILNSDTVIDNSLDTSTLNSDWDVLKKLSKNNNITIIKCTKPKNSSNANSTVVSKSNNAIPTNMNDFVINLPDNEKKSLAYKSNINSNLQIHTDNTIILTDCNKILRSNVVLINERKDQSNQKMDALPHHGHNPLERLIEPINFMSKASLNGSLLTNEENIEEDDKISTSFIKNDLFSTDFPEDDCNSDTDKCNFEDILNSQIESTEIDLDLFNQSMKTGCRTSNSISNSDLNNSDDTKFENQEMDLNNFFSKELPNFKNSNLTRINGISNDSKNSFKSKTKVHSRNIKINSLNQNNMLQTIDAHPNIIERIKRNQNSLKKIFISTASNVVLNNENSCQADISITNGSKPIQTQNLNTKFNSEPAKLSDYFNITDVELEPEYDKIIYHPQKPVRTYTRQPKVARLLSSSESSNVDIAKSVIENKIKAKVQKLDNFAEIKSENSNGSSRFKLVLLDDEVNLTTAKSTLPET